MSEGGAEAGLAGPQEVAGKSRAGLHRPARGGWRKQGNYCRGGGECRRGGYDKSG